MFSALLRNNWHIEIVYLRLKHGGLKHHNLYFIYVFLSLFWLLEIFYATIFPMTKIYLKYSNSSSFVLVFFLYEIQVSLKETILVKTAVIWSHFDKNHFIFLLIYSYSCEESHVKCLYFSYVIFLYGLSQEIGYSSLCCTVGLSCLSILNVIVCIYQPQIPSQSLSLPDLLATTSLISISVNL